METAIILPNDGYLRGCLPRDLFKSLLDEALTSKNHPTRETGVVDINGDQTISGDIAYFYSQDFNVFFGGVGFLLFLKTIF